MATGNIADRPHQPSPPGYQEAIRADEEVVPASEQSGEFKELDERTRHVRRLILGALLQLAIGSAVGPLQGPPLALRAPSKLGVLVAQPCTSPVYTFAPCAMKQGYHPADASGAAGDGILNYRLSPRSRSEACELDDRQHEE